ncbi:hypothetical protein Y032_0025g1202 [Ancylostoma ceylanicum]|uniref:Uncharacterized protein n=1 Tax=Ancylostoma ceylanicum TaxID=53326 RepID=A0A016UVE7_9BILA|nr:hypothetical protein Y032_0025g1202 [Ancylostoma ceylanicum]
MMKAKFSNCPVARYFYKYFSTCPHPSRFPSTCVRHWWQPMREKCNLFNVHLKLSKTSGFFAFLPKKHRNIGSFGSRKSAHPCLASLPEKIVRGNHKRKIIHNWGVTEKATSHKIT